MRFLCIFNKLYASRTTQKKKGNNSFYKFTYIRTYNTYS